MIKIMIQCCCCVCCICITSVRSSSSGVVSVVLSKVTIGITCLNTIFLLLIHLILLMLHDYDSIIWMMHHVLCRVVGMRKLSCCC